ncbi:hypothetical protein RB597_006510 [Gaeumannomyces tritici]
MGDNGRGGRFNRGGGQGGGFGRDRVGESNNDNNDGQRGNTAPCPGGNGTTIGTSQSFSLQCGLNLGGDVLNEMPMISFIGCVDACASTHPRCDGVSFNGRTCRVRAGANIAQSSRPSDGFDSALAIFPTAINPRCGTLGPSMQTSPSAGSKRFNVSCANVLDGGDFLQQHTATFFDCTELCARSSACVAVSYDWKMTGGFNNCYLKNSVADIIGVQDIDTAILNRGGNSGGGTTEQPASNPAPPASSSPAAGGGSGQGVVLVPIPSGQPAFSTPSPPTAQNPVASSGLSAPPAQASSAATTRGPSQSVTAPGPSSATFATSTRGSLVQPPAPGTSNTTPPVQPQPEQLPATAASSQAWIAAPVVGGVAAIMLIAVVFAILGRRRGWIRGWGSRGKSSGSDAGKSISGEKGGGGRGQIEGDDEWLRDAERGAASMGDGGRNNMAANASRSIRSSRSSRSSIGGVTAGSRPDLVPSMPPPLGQTPRYQVKNGRMALHNSQHGQLQDDTGNGAVPDFLKESRVERQT